MPKRTLAVQNKGSDQEQQQSSTTRTRSSVKRNNTDETVSTKKAKIEEKITDKENIPKPQVHRNNKSKPVRSPSPPPQPVLIIEPTVIDDSDTSDESDDDDFDIYDDTDDDDDDEEEEVAPLARSTTNIDDDDDDDGKDHPTNKQYVIYENLGPNKETFVISKTARYWNKKYCKDVRNSNPDAFGLYIHNDFSCYGELEVVENCLLDLTKTVFVVQQGIIARMSLVRKPADKVNYILGFRRLETLTLLLDYTDGISGIDDGERFDAIMRVIGACYVTILRGLLPQVMFQKIENIDRNLVKKLASISKQIPNFKQVLERALTIGHTLVTIGDLCSAYTNILQIVYYNWVFIMENTTIDFKSKPANIKEDVWDALKHGASIDKNDVEGDEPETFDFFKELRIYAGEYGLGGNDHDISKWSQTKRAAHSLHRFNPSVGFWF